MQSSNVGTVYGAERSLDFEKFGDFVSLKLGAKK
jgi:hypothetical protein